MKINYPIKYTAMPIYEQTGWNHGLNELEREYNVVCYIVSKCHLLNNLTKYKETGEEKKEYEVVFPYQSCEYGTWERNVPEFNLYNNNCINSNIVEEVFESYEEAQAYVTTKNNELCQKSILNIPFSEKLNEEIENKRAEFYDKLNKYELLEEQITNNTSELDKTKVKKLDPIIYYKDNNAKIIKSNLYQTISLFHYEKYIVYTITKDEYEKILNYKTNMSKNIIDSEIKNKKVVLIHNSNDQITKIYDKGESTHYVDEYEVLHKSDKIKKVTKDELENIDDENYVFYTTETKEDIITSYKKYENIELNEIQGPVLKKVRN